jgi:uncharacterized protein with PIN domain
MQEPLRVNINMDWVEVKTDASRCEVCNDVIVTKMFQLVIFVGYEPQETKHKICEHCYAQLNDRTGKT